MMSSKSKNIPSYLKWSTYLGMLMLMLFIHACSHDNEVPLTEESTQLLTDQKNEIFSTNVSVDTVITFDPATGKETFQVVRREEQIYNQPDVMPVFGDCGNISDKDKRMECSNQNTLQFVYSNVKYPEEARTKGIEGVTVTQFVVAKDGRIHSEKIVRSIHASTDVAVLNVIGKMKASDTKWTAGKHGGENVSTKFTLPIKFKLEG